ncbi:claudin-34-like [Odontesthes bonariensis]|uniref:claudin-34-like n=1 Tax=Odontesthes bonariensis TaxID=219752 RepID=UPI003F58787E
MAYLAHTAHAQFGGLWLACIGWTLTAMALGLIQWRVWQVSNTEVITSGEAWIGIWRACFNSHTAVTDGLRTMHCSSISLTEENTPPEIAAAQLLMLPALLLGLCGYAWGIYTMRNAYFGVKKSSLVRVGFISTGALFLTAAGMSLIPLLWNLSSVVTNRTVVFPPEFKLPESPESQRVGCGIWVGMLGAVLMVSSGIIFCSYRLPVKSLASIQASLEQLEQDLRGVITPAGKDNPAFECDEHF